MPKFKHYVFTVEGTFAFPCDMLRYDGCYPTSTEAAVEMSSSIDRKFREPGQVYKVTLISDRPPTDGRWQSFGWRVTNVEGRGY